MSPAPDLLSWVAGRGLTSSRWQLLLAMGVIAVLGIAFLSRIAVFHDGKIYFTLADDAMISMTYAKNLAHGAGLVWVPGEAPVEGYTNPLWTVWMAVMHVIAPVDRWAPLLTALSGLVCLMAGLAAANRLAWRLGLSPAGRAFALVSAATLFGPTFWTLRGFEIGALIAIQGWMLALTLNYQDRSLRQSVILGVLAAAAFLTRMDSLVMSAAILSLRFVGLQRRDVKTALLSWGILAVAAAGLFVARVAYYGDLLPNTVYLKLESVSLVQRLRQGLAADYHVLIRWLPLILFAILPLFLMRKEDGAKRTALFGVLFIVAIQFAYTAYVGGDAWEWSHFPDRFVSLIAYPLCVAAGSGFGEALDRLNLSKRTTAGATATVAVLVFGWIGFSDWRTTLAGKGFQFDEEKYLVEAGLNLKASTPPGFRYGLTWAGTIPYYAEGRRPVDLLGKMDRVIAHSKPEPGEFKPGHNKYDLNYSLGKLRPDAMLQPPDDIVDDPGMPEKVRAWGYVITAGGWWILPESARQLTDKRILNARFWWGTVLPPSNEVLGVNTSLPASAEPTIDATVEDTDGDPTEAPPTAKPSNAGLKTAKAGAPRSSPPRTVGNAPQRATQQSR